MEPTNSDFDKKLGERFDQLPKIVQDAITSADVEKHLRELAEHHKLHLDQWEKLENEVMLALLGFQQVESLRGNIQKEVGVDEATANALAEDISTIVFAPIRQELERELGEQDTVAAHQTAPVPVPTAATPVAPASTVSITTPQAVPQAPREPVAPATPTPTPVEGKVERAPLSTNYMASQASHERKTIEGDPYREQLA
ncbi:MAG TPA: hypothetical protein VHD38_01380 [Candidatus Paceibacterota bacterium]|nr:hypothetical protein [Candidatus Paceibacterota bacterium]